MLNRYDDGVIRITKDEALSNKVDDFLKRQASLRGDTGITRDRRARWIYQNWFVFMLSGIVACAVAWALLEPFFDDFLYIQGEIESLDLSEPMPQRFESGDQYLELMGDGQGWVEIRGERVWLLLAAKEIDEGPAQALDRSKLREGIEIGLYVKWFQVGSKSIGLAMFVQMNPPRPPQAKALMSLASLNARTQAAGLLILAVVAGFIGLAIGGVDGMICRLPRRALLGGVLGLLLGLLGGFVMNIVANLVYMPINLMAMREMMTPEQELSTPGFLLQMMGRTLAWSLAGTSMGLGQGIALRSKRLLLYGFLGGVLGGLLGGLFFDPIDILLLGMDKPSAHWSRLIGFCLIGASVGAMIGIVELLTRDAWLRMLQGPLAGKEFLLFKDTMQIGASPRSDLYLFNDDMVAPIHATLRAMGDVYEVESGDPSREVLVNNRPSRRVRLRHGDQITIGRTVFVFEKRGG